MENNTPPADRTASSSLVESIVRQAEENSRQQSAAAEPAAPYPTTEPRETKNWLGTAVILAAGAGLLHFVLLSDAPFLYEKLGYSNFTRTEATQTAYAKQLATDLSDVTQFQALLRAEGLATALGSLDLDDATLRYQLPVGEWVERDGAKFFRFAGADGQLLEMAEANVQAAQEKQAERAAAYRTALQKMTELATADANTKFDKNYAEIAKQIKQLGGDLSSIDFQEKTFPSAATLASVKSAQTVAKDILVKIKEINLKNLVADLKKQTEAVNAKDLDETALATLNELKTLVAGLNVKSPRTFESASKKVSTMNLKALPGTTAIGGDLNDAAVIAGSLGRVNFVNTLAQKRIAWQDVLQNVRQIARLGADLLPDEGEQAADRPAAFADIDPTGELVAFNGFSADVGKNTLSLRGTARDGGAFAGQNFTLVSRLIDAFEGSTYFQNVSGLNFSKSKLRDGSEAIPLNLQLELQPAGTASPLDAVQPKAAAKKYEAVTKNTEDKSGAKNTDTTNEKQPATKDSAAVDAATTKN